MKMMKLHKTFRRIYVLLFLLKMVSRLLKLCRIFLLFHR